MMERGRDGFFLVGVLVFCFILIPVIAVFAQSSLSIVRNTSTFDQRFRTEFLAAGLAEALASRLTSDRDLLHRFHSEGSIHCLFGKSMFHFRIQDHDGKIDLNNADSELLKAGFRAAGLSIENATTLQQFVEAFRSNGNLPNALQSTLPSLKHAPFERIEELNDAVALLKLAPIDFEPYFTVYKRVGNLEYETASQPLKVIIDASPEIKGEVATDNGSFDYIDIIADVTQPGERRYALLKTYTRLAAVGEVREVAGKSLPLTEVFADNIPEAPSTACSAILGILKAAQPNG